jgi:hypothetical protein
VPSATQTPVGGTSASVSDDDGCQIGALGGHSGAWLLLMPAVGLLAMRRRYH